MYHNKIGTWSSIKAMTLPHLTQSISSRHNNKMG